jgi:hypothetical protein
MREKGCQIKEKKTRAHANEVCVIRDPTKANT